MTKMQNQMQIKTEVKATINQIKQLIAEKYNISIDFDLEIVDEMRVGVGDDKVQVGAFVGKQEEQPKDTPWYPDNSGEWVEVYDNFETIPTGLINGDRIEYLFEFERESKNFRGTRRTVEEVCRFDFTNECGYKIVAYKEVK